MSFVHLHTHTEYSLLDGSNKIKEYVKCVKALGMNAAAITDHGVMYGAIDFYRAAKAEGIKPIIGCEVYVAPGSRFDKEQNAGEERYHHLILLAENNTGYSNLIKIVSRGFTEGFYYKPRVDKEVLREYHEGIICCSACLAGEVQRFLAKGLYEEAKKAACSYLDIFGKGNFFLELQDHGLAEQQEVNTDLLRMSKELDIPLVVTNDVHYTYAEDVESHDILLCIQTGKKVNDEDRLRYEGGQFYVKSEEEMRRLFPYALEAIENTQKIADRCNVEFEFGKYKLPHFEVPDGYTSWEYLRKLCFDGLDKRYPNHEEELVNRLEYELETIHKMGFVDYFLIVWDFINYAKTHGIAVGPGRGSAAGSIVSYCLEITNIEPIRYNLLFERFLNPGRVTMPDIDIDFCYEHRQDVIDYVIRKYGKEKVVQIVTFGTLAAKGVIRDVGRVLDLPYSYCSNIAKAVPNELNITLAKALESGTELRQIYDSDEQAKSLIDLCMKLEGLPRHTSMHAAGVVICPEAADEYVPLSRASDGTITTQYVMTTLEELGLLKMDFLGLRTLTVIQNAAKYASVSANKTINMDEIDYNDPEVFAYIGTGKTDGVFQLESGGMKSFMKELKPKSMEDIIAGISLYRPGPMDFIPQYIKGKNSKEDITYECKELEPILAPTYGCIVYQEQVMQIVRALAGYTMGQADNIRRAMSKKKQYVIDAERKNFVSGNAEEKIIGCVGNGISETVANSIYDSMVDFAKYAFNKSHAAAYAVVAYQTAWLKHYYPVEFMAALMTSVMDKFDKVSYYSYVCKAMNIKILPPDINESIAEFSAENGAIRYALASVKGLGVAVVTSIISERNAGGPFASLKDFITRLSGKVINKKSVESLIQCGAFDRLGANRHQLMMVYNQIMDSVAQDRKHNMEGQMSIFDLFSSEEKKEYELTLPNVEEFDKETLLGFEKDILGLYISGHPLDEYEDLWRKNITNHSIDFTYDDELMATKVVDGKDVIIGGIIDSKDIRYTKKGKAMAILIVEDLLGTVEVVVWPNDYERNSQYLIENSKIFIKGRVSAEEEKDAKVMCDKIIPFDSVPKRLWIKYKDEASYETGKDELFGILHTSDGKDQVVIYLEDSKKIMQLPRNHSVEASSDTLLKALYDLLGEEQVKAVCGSIK